MPKGRLCRTRRPAGEVGGRPGFEKDAPGYFAFILGLPHDEQHLLDQIRIGMAVKVAFDDVTPPNHSA